MLPQHRPPHRPSSHMPHIHLRPPWFLGQLLCTIWNHLSCTSTSQSVIPEPRPKVRRSLSSSVQANSGRTKTTTAGVQERLDRYNRQLCERSRGYRPRPPALHLSSLFGSSPQLNRSRSPVRTNSRHRSPRRCTLYMCNRRWVNHRARRHRIRASRNRSETGLGATPQRIFAATAATLLQHGGQWSTLLPRSRAQER